MESIIWESTVIYTDDDDSPPLIVSMPTDRNGFPLFMPEFLELDAAAPSGFDEKKASSLIVRVRQYVAYVGKTSELPNGFSNADGIMAKLAHSGMLPICLRLILGPGRGRPIQELERQGRETALVMFDTCCHKDIVWQSGYNGDVFVDMARLKVFLGCIPYLAEVNEETTDPKVIVGLTRLVARTIMSIYTVSFNLLNRRLLEIGADADLWTETVRAGGDFGGLVMPLADAPSKVLGLPSYRDRKFLQWLLSNQVAYDAIEGWIKEGIWKRSPEIAVGATSWIKVRALLLVGIRYAYKSDYDDDGSLSLSSASADDNWDDVKVQTLAGAANLRMSCLEQKDGSETFLCSNSGCFRGGSSSGSGRCSQCKYARYCSKTCQKAHWRNGHKQECTILKICAGDNEVDWNKLKLGIESTTTTAN